MEAIENTTVGIPTTSALVDLVMDYFPTKSTGDYSDEFTFYLTVIIVVGFCTSVSVFGIFANIVNLIVFKRQGFRDTVNITLFSTAISDLIALVSTLWVGLCYNPLFISSDLPFLPQDIEYLTGQIPHVIAMNITGGLTAFVAFERCLCIAYPLKVKDIITATRTKIVIFSIFAFNIAVEFPMLWIYSFEQMLDQERNETILSVIFNEKYALMEAVKMYVAYVFGLFTSFIIVVVCSAIIVVKLNQKTKWRMSVTAKTGNEEVVLNRDRKVIKMVFMVAVIYLATYTPTVIMFIRVGLDNYEISPTGSLANTYFVIVSSSLAFDVINASANIFVYYYMSSKYRSVFRSIFFCGHGKE